MIVEIEVWYWFPFYFDSRYVWWWEISVRSISSIKNCILTLANTSASDWLGWVTIISFLAIVTVSSWKWKRDYVWIIFSPLHRKSPIQTCGKVSTGQTHASRLSSRKFVQFHVESTSSCMTVTVAHWNEPKKSCY